MRLPRLVLLPACAGLTALAYYLILFTNWGNYYRSSTYLGTVVTGAVAVLAVFACIEVIRTEKATPIRAVAGAVAFPLFLVVLLILWLGVRRYLAT